VIDCIERFERIAALLAVAALLGCGSAGAGFGDAANDCLDSCSDAGARDAGANDAGANDACANDAGTLDELEALFAAGFSPRTDPTSVEDLQMSGLGIHCLGAALALQRSRQGAAFEPELIADLELALQATVQRLIDRAPDFDGGWGEGEPRDFFSDGSINSADTADSYNTSYATWCLTEADEMLESLAPALAAQARALVADRHTQYRSGGFSDADAAEQLCDECAYFWYSRSPNDRGRYVKNVNALMGIASFLHGLRTSDAVAEESGRRALRSQAREVGGDGVRNLNYLSTLDRLYDPARGLYNTHNYIESLVLLHAGELLHSDTYVCRALGQYRAWVAEVESTQTTQVAYASCHFARRDASARTRCQAWIDDGHGLTNLAGVGLLMNYWPEDDRTAASMCP